MKKIIVLLALSMFILFNIQNVKAFNEYTDAVLSITGNKFSPRVACSDDDTKCILMFYDNDTKEVKVKYSWKKGNHFRWLNDNCNGWFDDWWNNCKEIASIPSYNLSNSINYYNGSLPFDVTYYNDKFYFFISFDYHFTVYSYDGNLNTEFNQGSFINPYFGINFYNSTHFFGIGCLTVGEYSRFYTVICNIISKSCYKIDPDHPFYVLHSVAGGIFLKMSGIALSENKWAFKFYLDKSSSEHGINNININEQYSDLYYYLGNYLYYAKDNNRTKRGYTTDLSLWSLSDVYSWNKLEWEENITGSDSYQDSTNRLYVFKRETNQTSGNISGIYVYNREIIPIYITNTKLNPNTENFEPAYPQWSLYVPSENYSTSGYGSSITLYTPSRTDMSFQSISSYNPSLYNFSLSIPDSCGNWFISAKYIDKANVTLKVIDSNTGQPIQNANIEITGYGSTTTNSDGEAYYNLFPFTATFSRTDYNDSCNTLLTQQYSSPMIYTVSSNATNYESYYGSFKLYENGVYNTYIVISMTPVMSEIRNHIYDLNGKEISPQSGKITISVNDTNATIICEQENKQYIRNWCDKFPSKFLISSTGTIEANESFTYMSWYQNKTNIILEISQIASVNWIFNATVMSFPCESSGDCLESFCDNNIYYHSIGCVNSQCEYSPESCANYCDDYVGCYDLESNISCSIYSCPSYCDTNYTLRQGMCGSDSMCKYRYVLCEKGCSGDKCVGISDSCNMDYGQKTLFKLFTSSKVYTEYYAICKKTDLGKSFCVAGHTFPTNETVFWVIKNIEGGIPTEDIWEHENGKFYDISVTCGYVEPSLSNETQCWNKWTFCHSGCDTSTGLCIGSTTEPEEIDIYKPLVNETEMQNAGIGWLSNVFSPILIMLFLCLGVGGIAGKETDSWEFGLVVFISMIIIMTLLGYFPTWFILVFIIIAGIILAKSITGFGKGG